MFVNRATLQQDCEATTMEELPTTFLQRKLDQGKYQEARDFCRGAFTFHGILALIFLGLGITATAKGDMFDRYIAAPLLFLVVLLLLWVLRRIRSWMQPINRHT